ncbi:MAG TPA: PEGA domain-containing protein [Membranihabitans sp.]|nr:PEGA domain-containing protein [Membranihabitans sp.]
MNNILLPSRLAALFMASLILFSSCASTTIIQSTPNGARLYLNGEPVGNTPYTHKDTKIVGSTNSIRLEKEGYETLNTSFARNEEADVGAIIGGIFFLVPFLWTMKYKPVHHYEMVPLDPNRPNQVNENIPNDNVTGSKAERLRELKGLLDDKIITEEEFEKEKQKILNEKS